MFKKKYYLNPHTLQFEPARKPLKVRLRNGLIYISILSLLAVGFRFSIDNYFITPKVKYLSQQNDKLKKEYDNLNHEIINAEKLLEFNKDY